MIKKDLVSVSTKDGVEVKFSKQRIKQREASPVEPEKLQIKFSFLLDELHMKIGIWKMKIKVLAQMKKVQNYYGMRLFLDPEPFVRRLNALHKRKQEIVSTPSLDRDGDEIQKEGIETDIRATEKEHNELKAICKEIDCTAQVFTVEYRISETVIVLIMPKDTINILNELLLHLPRYALELTPIN